MDSETRQIMKSRIDRLIEKANEEDEAARSLIALAEDRSSTLSKALESTTSSRKRRQMDAPSSIEAQVEELRAEAARKREIVAALWIKIHTMQEEERGH